MNMYLICCFIENNLDNLIYFGYFKVHDKKHRILIIPLYL